MIAGMFANHLLFSSLRRVALFTNRVLLTPTQDQDSSFLSQGLVHLPASPGVAVGSTRLQHRVPQCLCWCHQVETERLQGLCVSEMW